MMLLYNTTSFFFVKEDNWGTGINYHIVWLINNL